MNPQPAQAIAHVRIDARGQWVVHALDQHLHAVARLSASFAAAFGNADWGQLAGLWHDLGKYKQDFQTYIRDRSGYERDEADEGGPGKVDHTTAGAIHAVDRLGPRGHILAYLIAGHHAGLPDWTKEAATPGGALVQRLEERRHLEETLAARPPAVVLEASAPNTRPCGRQLANVEHVHLWIRMLFSCLVDADFLDTEAFMDPAAAATRSSAPSLAELRRRYDEFMGALRMRAAATPLNDARQRILNQCRRAAAQAAGLFSLTVPTGGGKTLASIGFALDHALAHGKRRIVVAIPYTSIIEQTAGVLRQVFGDEAVLEHHSNLDPDQETLQSKLATENWDAPIIVTTNVQLFESLHASKTSACRKLHNLVDAVIVLDEAQMLPPEHLRPILSSIKGLTTLFGATVVMCTATQPALQGRIGGPGTAFDGLSNVREIMEDHGNLASTLRRVRVSTRKGLAPVAAWDEIAAEAGQHERILVIVNTRRDCRELHALMPTGTVHLSASMCGEHRSRVIARIKDDLRNGGTVRVVSTQLVEAGVDIDFPIVYRALAGFDSIAQAAGRCNREGLLAEGALGQVVVFAGPRETPPGLIRKGADATRELYRVISEPDIELSPNAFHAYFETFYRRVNSFDEANVGALLAGSDARAFKIQFRTAARRFRLIDDQGQRSVIVWYDAPHFRSREVLEELSRFGPTRARMRRLQRCTVNIPERAWAVLREQGAIQEVLGPTGRLGLWAQSIPGLYDEQFGLRMEGPAFAGDEFVC